MSCSCADGVRSWNCGVWVCPQCCLDDGVNTFDDKLERGKYNSQWRLRGDAARGVCWDWWEYIHRKMKASTSSLEAAALCVHFQKIQCNTFMSFCPPPHMTLCTLIKCITSWHTGFCSCQTCDKILWLCCWFQISIKIVVFLQSTVYWQMFLWNVKIYCIKLLLTGAIPPTW